MSPQSIKRFTRKQLFDLVWSQPMTNAASTFGFSDVWLKKVCRKHGIPVPGRGYWRRIEAGKRSRKPPPRAHKDEESISITVHGKVKERSVTDLTAVEVQNALKQLDENRIHTSGTLERLHSITAATRKHLLALRRTD